MERWKRMGNMEVKVVDTERSLKNIKGCEKT